MCDMARQGDATERLSILLIEDNGQDSARFKEWLEEECGVWPGADVTCFFNLRDALSHLSGSGHDLILTDLMLPDSIGLSTIGALSQAVPTVPIVALTGSDDPDLESMALAFGAHDFISKMGLKDRWLRRSVRYAVERSRAQAQTDLDRRKYEAIVSHAPLPLVALDSRGHVQHMNPAAETTFGWTLEEARGKSPPWLPEGEQSGFDDLLRRLRAGEIIRLEHVQRRHQSGEPLEIAVSVAPLFNHTGEFQGTIGLLVNVSEELKKQAELDEQTRIGRLAADVGLALSESESLRTELQRCCEAAVKHLDAAFCRIWTLDEALDTLLLQASAGLYTHIDGGHAHVPLGKFKIGRIASSRKALMTNSVQSDSQIGDPAWAKREGMVAFAGYPLVINDQLLGVMAMFSRTPLGDRTLRGLGAVARQIAMAIRRRQSEEMLLARTEILQGVTQAMNIFITSGNWAEANRLLLNSALQQCGAPHGFVAQVTPGGALRIQAFIAGEWTGEEGQRTFARYRKEFEDTGSVALPSGDNLLTRAIREGRTLLTNDPSATQGFKGMPEGHPPIESLLLAPCVLESEVVGLIGVANRPGGFRARDRERLDSIVSLSTFLQDIHRRRSSEQTLRDHLQQAEKMSAIGQLAGGVAHDFNNILTVMGGAAHFMRDEIPAQHPSHPDVETILQSVDRASTLTSQLLAFSRKQIVEPRTLDLRDTLKETERMLRRLIGEDVELQTHRPQNLRLVKADSGQMVQIFMNLAVNSRDAMPQGGKLEIGLEDVLVKEDLCANPLDLKPGPHVLLTVADTGIGMDSETIQQIFEPFFTTKGVGKGTGLGLATVYGIVKQAGGDISVSSEPGKGTRFSMYFPAIESAATHPDDHQTHRAKDDGKGETILVVEDDDMLRALATSVLTRGGFTVLTAARGTEALDICNRASQAIDLVLTDVVMPGMSGREAAEQIRKTRPGTPILYMSGYTDDAILRHGILTEEIEFLGKPFSPKALLEKVRSVLDLPAR